MFRKGGFSLKQRGNALHLRSLLVSLAAAVTMTTLFTMLASYLMQRGLLPAAWSRTAVLVSVSLSAAAAGVISGGKGRSGCLLGVFFALLWCLWRGIANPASLLRLSTLLEMGSCILCGFVGSCIFHKKQKRNTKRNQRRPPR